MYMLGAENPYTFGSKEYFAWINEQAAKAAKEQAKTDYRGAKAVEKSARAAQGKDEGINPMVIAALVIGGGALLYIVLKRSR
jgi:hypothetical protein